jgi:hypothetical protein
LDWNKGRWESFATGLNPWQLNKSDGKLPWVQTHGNRKYMKIICHGFQSIAPGIKPGAIEIIDNMKEM